jgi:hypothetical protein
MSNRNDTLSLKILEAYTRDVGRGVARLDYESMDPLNALLPVMLLKLEANVEPLPNVYHFTLQMKGRE